MMALMMGNLYEALRQSGATDEMSRKAAEEVPDFQKQLTDICSDLSLVKGLLGVVVAGVAALIVKTFFG